MAGYNPSGGSDANGLHAMLARLQVQRQAQNSDDPAAHELLSRFNSYNQGAGNSKDYYGSESLTGLDDFPPPAPTPPTNFSHPHQGPPLPLGPIGTMPPNPASKVDQSTNLLNLLKFSSSGQSTQAPSHTSPPAQSRASSFDVSTPSHSHTSNPPPIHAPVPMPADPQGLLATLMKGNAQNESSRAEPPVSNQPVWNAGPPPIDTQAYLLNLLHRPKPSQNDQPPANEGSQPSLTPQSAGGSVGDRHKEFTPSKQFNPDSTSLDTTPLPFKFGTADHIESPSAKFDFHSPVSQASQHDGSRKSSKHDYHTNRDEVSTASPLNGASKASTPGATIAAAQAPPAFKIAKRTPSATSSPGLSQDHRRLSSQRSPIASPENARQKFDPSPLSAEQGTDIPGTTQEATVEVVGNAEATPEGAAGIATQTNSNGAQAGLQGSGREEVRATLSAQLRRMMRAETDAEFQGLAEAAAKGIRKELGKQQNAGVLEDRHSPVVTQAIRDIVDDAAHGPVADSWESAEAEADEIVVIEDTPNPVRVYNFPMKPWISIAMQATNEPRPQFRDEVNLDIARLKKEFDQIDRNLVAATDTYMAYGMSKAGGIRVIRQDDGKDAKLFTDTKDRIFNVAMSSTPPDLNTTPKETIIGTGVSGTVYYVQIKNGDKDHLEDDHLEQYGFALPPISTQEGDTPGGVLKTRARTSSTHPDFFAVGRGKTISIIWPAYIMQNNIFKRGHDRVVDTERLSKECPLRINTGKAGKDFTFSQDDTTIVSLDKSGRVKFWDVRELTAADENSDPRSPLPAHTSLEVKEPLMTLNTTPEGEKAWPTSVLLLDKQRPYQKRCAALRYMIVGMKQNHTLQLWDLALGKPVQEFNLPHSRESDAVCSVMYHPPSGMIVVGHPTRNSIYFLHLSAPKYTIKGLSQVDYIQKLAAKDASIPRPEATAVISGVREYSFSKGVLRSLDILANPASASDSDEPTLFELYAMHSKGVTGIIVKQSEVGWNKDNKVIDGVDAAEVGLVKITQLKELPNALVSEPQPAEEPVPLPPRARPSKEVPQSSLTSPQEQPKKGGDSAPAAGPSERKEADLPVPPVTQPDKTEKKPRKKRDKAAAAAERLAGEHGQSNGNPQSSGSSKHGEATSSASSAHSTMSQESIQTAIRQISTGLNEKLSAIIQTEFKDHRDKVEAEFHVRDDMFVKSQKDLLDIVSNVLDQNIQAVLTKTISDQFDDTVVPALSDVVTKTISEQIDGKMVGRVSHSIQNQVQKLLPNTVMQALQKLDLTKTISDKITSSIALDIEENVRQTLISNITPMFTEMTVAASRSISQEVQDRTAEQIAELEQRHIADAKKIDQLTSLVTGLSDTISAMANAQLQFQDGLIKIQQQLSARDRGTATQSHTVPAQAAQSHHSQALQTQGSYSYGSPTGASSNQLVSYRTNSSGTRDPELQHMMANIASFMERGEYETGLVRWIQLDRKHEVFDEYLVKSNPQFLSELPALVSLSVASVISEQLEGPLLREKVNWVEVVLHTLHASLPHTVSHPPPPANVSSKRDSLQDPQVRDVIPSLMSSFIDRLEKLFVRIRAVSPADPILPRLSSMTNMAIRLRDAVRHPTY
ncbi:hypothetical protein GGS23DRAFT_501658 [Durotheca rogersii]|uniref:uncharacterized protein n=1 Tax=Durotheca rogersii TaxID=419775 RepID=UPI0022205FB7|nr:uncharacterized protein GGS23DRAFT_501658 [Durotheca rogersii]KAI5854070.1 hypothetical protein GGS23DRAFT_501658 [Durotheca rogersii]